MSQDFVIVGFINSLRFIFIKIQWMLTVNVRQDCCLTCIIISVANTVINPAWRQLDLKAPSLMLCNGNEGAWRDLTRMLTVHRFMGRIFLIPLFWQSSSHCQWLRRETKHKRLRVYVNYFTFTMCVWDCPNLCFSEIM